MFHPFQLPDVLYRQAEAGGGHLVDQSLRVKKKFMESIFNAFFVGNDCPP